MKPQKYKEPEPLKIIDSVKYSLRERSDNPYTFERVPLWLQLALTDGSLKAEFRSEDYWYLVLKTPEGNKLDVTPGDEILYYEDDTIGVKINNF